MDKDKEMERRKENYKKAVWNKELGCWKGSKIEKLKLEGKYS